MLWCAFVTGTITQVQLCINLLMEKFDGVRQLTQNVSITKIVDSSSIQSAESKYGLRIQFLALVVMIHEVGLMRKIVTWETIHVPALRSQMVSNDVC
jgi:hypothetical protein